jgi:transcriptional regulator with XRE-family HTH domain
VDPTSTTSIGERIRQRRQELGLSRRIFADRVFVEEETVRAWEQGLRNPSRQHRRLLEHQGVVVDELTLDPLRPSLDPLRLSPRGT